MEDTRPDSEYLLKKLQYEEEQKLKKNKGKLKIFLGYAAGSGKTYTMLEAAHEAKKHNTDVVAGYIEPHDRPDTRRQAEGLETIPPLVVEYKGVKLREFDLDRALERKPQLILVDELAHTNAPGCRNEKRYQDVKELLRAGIDVYTTINIQHLESLNDLVGSITHIEVRERIPDSVFDHADQVEVIDIEPEDLLARMKEGKIYKPVQAERAMNNFFKREKLAALREITLRRTADRVNRIAEEERNITGDTQENIFLPAFPPRSQAQRSSGQRPVLPMPFAGSLQGFTWKHLPCRKLMKRRNRVCGEIWSLPGLWEQKSLQCMVLILAARLQNMQW